MLSGGLVSSVSPGLMAGLLSVPAFPVFLLMWVGVLLLLIGFSPTSLASLQNCDHDISLCTKVVKSIQLL